MNNIKSCRYFKFDGLNTDTMKFYSGFSTLIFLFTNLLAFGQSIPAFPGAEGFGASASGGRGGRVIYVTNLNASGPGSFNDALSQTGPRYILFKVSGVIDAAAELREEMSPSQDKPRRVVSSPEGFWSIRYMNRVAQVTTSFSGICAHVLMTRNRFLPRILSWMMP